MMLILLLCCLATSSYSFRVSSSFVSKVRRISVPKTENSDGLTGLRPSLSTKLSSWDEFDEEDWGEDMFGSSDNTQLSTEVEKKCIFVGNLPFETTEQELQELAENNGVPAGIILSSRIATKFNGNSRGFGYLEFSDSDVASEALESLRRASSQENGLKIRDRILKLDLDVGFDGPGKGRRHTRTSKSFSLFLGNLDFACDSIIVEDFIKEMIAEKVKKERNVILNNEQIRINRLASEVSETGEHISRDNLEESDSFTLAEIDAYTSTPIRVKLAKDPVSGRSRGFGQAYFESERVRDFALEALYMTELNGRELTVAVTKKKRASDSADSWTSTSPAQRDRGRKAADPDARISSSIFLGNLPYDISVGTLTELMEKVLGPDKVTAVRLAQDPYTGRSKGYGHLDLKSPEDCESAVAQVHGITLSGRTIKCDFATNTQGEGKGGGIGNSKPRTGSRGGSRGRGASQSSTTRRLRR